MPSPRGDRRGRRVIGGILGFAAALSLVSLAPLSSSYADDDYPYRGLGQCPLVPLPPHPPTPPGGTPGHPAQPGQQPGNRPGDKPGNKPGNKPGQPAQPGTPATPPVKTPPPPRVCAKHIWFINGSYGDPWGFALRNCTSFVAWRMRETNGFADFYNDLSGGHWGNAAHWDDNARALGYLVDHVPAVGAIAQTDAGRIGHVAWVEAVGEGTVTVEEYNYYSPGGYDVRTVPTSDFRYLHVDDLAPAPDLGSARAATTAIDAQGRTWTARTTAQGDLTVRRPTGRVVRVGVPGAWSPYAAPSLVADRHGHLWLAAVSSDGRLLTAHTSAASPRWSRLRAHGLGGWSTTSTPTLVVDGQQRVRLFAVTSSGTLFSQRTTSARSERWARFSRMGLPGSWSTHAAPAVATDRFARLWVVAVTRGGSLQARHTLTGGLRWSGFHAVDHRSWALTSTPSLTLADDGALWLAAVTSHGSLFTRHTDGRSGDWRGLAPIGGLWSPYASPATTTDSFGRLWLATTNAHGSVGVRYRTAHSKRWWAPGDLVRSTGPVTTGPALGATPNGGVRLGAVTGGGRVLWQRAGEPDLGAGPDRFSATRGMRFQP
jgi:surface antigen